MSTADMRRRQLVQALGWNADADHTFTDALEEVRALREKAETAALGDPHPPSAESELIEFLRAHVGCCVVMAAKGDLARALVSAGYRKAGGGQ